MRAPRTLADLMPDDELVGRGGVCASSERQALSANDPRTGGVRTQPTSDIEIFTAQTSGMPR
jgi:hypothetical protein